MKRATASGGSVPPVGLFGLQTNASRARGDRGRHRRQVERAVGPHGHLDGAPADPDHVLRERDEARVAHRGLVPRPDVGLGEEADQRVRARTDDDGRRRQGVARRDRLEERPPRIRVATCPPERVPGGLDGAREWPEEALVGVELRDVVEPEARRERRGRLVRVVRREPRVVEPARGAGVASRS